MSKVIVEQIISADGYAQDSTGGIGFFGSASWINDVDTEQLRMLGTVSAIVLGARTYRMFADYWPSAAAQAEPVAQPINALPKFVISSTLSAAPWGNGKAEVRSGDGVETVRELRRRFAGNLIIWGSLTLSDALLRADEVDVLRLRVLPLLLGAGRSFSPSGVGIRKLALTKAQSFGGGVVLLEYAKKE